MTDDEIKVLISAQADQLKTGMDDAKAAVAGATGQMKDGLDQLSSSTASSASQIANSFKKPGAAAKEAAATGKDAFSSFADDLSSSASRMMAPISAILAGGAAVTGAFAGIGAIYLSAVNDQDEWVRSALQLGRIFGITAEDASVLMLAMEELAAKNLTAGVSVELLERAFIIFQNKLAGGSEEIKKWGITWQGTAMATFMAALAKYQELTSAAEKAQFASDFFTRRIAVGLMPVLQKLNASALGPAAEKGKELGRIVGVDVVEASQKLAVSGLHLHEAWQKLNTQLGDPSPWAALKGFLASTLGMISSFITETENAAAAMRDLNTVGGVPGGGGLAEVFGAGAGAAAGAAAGARKIMPKKDEPGPAPEKLGAGGGGGGAGPGLLQQWKDELSQIKTEQNAFLDFSKAKEREFWEDKLSQCAAGSKEYLAVSREIYTLDKGLAQEAAKEKIAQFERQMTSEKSDWEARKALMAQELAFVKTTYGADSSEYRAALNKKAQFDQEYDRQQRTLAQSRLDNELKLGQMRIAAAQEEVKFKENMGQISAGTAAAQEKALTQQSLALEKNHIDQSLANWKGYYQQTQKYAQDEAQFKEKKLLEVQKANQQAAQKQLQDIKSALAPIDTAINGMVMGFIQGTLTMQKAMANFATAMLSAFLGALEKMLTTWIANELQILIFGGDTTSKQIGQQAGVVYIENLAGLIPDLGPWDAPEAAAMMTAAELATAAGMSGVASAAGGWDVDADSLTYLHKKEMVLRPDLAEGIRSLVRGPGAGQAPGGAASQAPSVIIQPGAVQIVAMDGTDVQRVLLNNPNALAAAIKGLGRNFVPVS